ncbi:hypothetical protein BDV93DRAFT_558352 [Ceratobasidium sp. AG-I]|nr:hypothetical protein BDV93DRAFT_558352 [Ceratobasidium sp. AG-I]
MPLELATVVVVVAANAMEFIQRVEVGHDCSWKVEDDARRPATKQLVESLRIKIQVLEAEVSRLQAQNEDNPAGPSNTIGSHAPEHSGSLSSSSSMPVLSGTGENPLPSSVASNTTLTGTINDVQEESSYIERHPLSTKILSTTLTYQYIFHIDISVPPESLPEATQLSLACDWGRNLPQLGNVLLSRLEHDTLLYRSFKYGTSWLLAVVPDLFLRDLLYFNGFEPSNALSRLPTPHYSPLLHCCLLAFATAYSDSNEIRSYIVRNQFAAHAKRLLDDELAQPAPSLIQALALLAEYHCGIGERDAGYMYMGMSFRAARALKLLNDPKVVEGGESSLSPDSIINEWLFWSAFAQDKLMVLEFARGYDIPLPPAGVNLPAISLVQDTPPWSAGPDATSGSSDNQSNRVTQVFLETSKLMIITARITDTIYCQGPSETFVPEDSTAINLHLQLDTWFNKLPSELLISIRASIAPLPYVILINICYWRILMYLHQPFYQRNLPTDGPPNRDSRLFSDLSIKMCDRAAYKILQLINIFDQSYGLRFFPRNMMQASH